jgi:hypothetical protein
VAFFVADRIDSKSGKLVFNRTVTLKESRGSAGGRGEGKVEEPEGNPNERTGTIRTDAHLEPMPDLLALAFPRAAAPAAGAKPAAKSVAK